MKNKELLDKAYEIYELLRGSPQSHLEWANRFNVVGNIIKILKDENTKTRT